ncbi:hypothetical protein JCM11251_001940 [Rhodosporidiobolus azoricus]
MKNKRSIGAYRTRFKKINERKEVEKRVKDQLDKAGVAIDDNADFSPERAWTAEEDDIVRKIGSDDRGKGRKAMKWTEGCKQLGGMRTKAAIKRRYRVLEREGEKEEADSIKREEDSRNFDKVVTELAQMDPAATKEDDGGASSDSSGDSAEFGVASSGGHIKPVLDPRKRRRVEVERADSQQRAEQQRTTRSEAAAAPDQLVKDKEETIAQSPFFGTRPSAAEPNPFALAQSALPQTAASSSGPNASSPPPSLAASSSHGQELQLNLHRSAGLSRVQPFSGIFERNASASTAKMRLDSYAPRFFPEQGHPHPLKRAS